MLDVLNPYTSWTLRCLNRSAFLLQIVLHMHILQKSG